jgi:hypothetical protein
MKLIKHVEPSETLGNLFENYGNELVQKKAREKDSYKKRLVMENIRTDPNNLKIQHSLTEKNSENEPISTVTTNPANSDYFGK